MCNIVKEFMIDNVPVVAIVDTREYLYGEYSVEVLHCDGYITEYNSKNLNKCIMKARSLVNSLKREQA